MVILYFSYEMPEPIHQAFRFFLLSLCHIKIYS